MADNLFQGLPPPSAPPPPPHADKQQQQSSITILNVEDVPQNPPAQPPPALKSALKRTKLPDSLLEAPAPKKRLSFKMTTDASETQVIEAMKKIASHITNVSKFSKASKLAIQLIQAGSVKPGTRDYFFAILEAAMSPLSTCNNPSVRADYHALFAAAQESIECLRKHQRNQLTAWTIRAVVANDLFTDDSFVFSKACGRVKEAILNLPIATKDEDMEEAAALKDETEELLAMNAPIKNEMSSVPISEANDKDEPDPFGLDVLIPSASSRRDEKLRIDSSASKMRKHEEEESKRSLKSEREALILCLGIAAKRYKTPWCQTVIDILVKHAFDNVPRFTAKQRDAIRELWASIREQQTRRRQGNSVSGKLDVNGFERLQQMYANEKISIRHSVGGGTRRAEQWLG